MSRFWFEFIAAVNYSSQLMRHRSAAFTLLEMLATVAIMALLIGLIASAVIKVRSRADRVSCQNKIRQSAIAIANYSVLHGYLPKGTRHSEQNRDLEYTSWRVSILSFLEQDQLWQAILTAYDSEKRFEKPQHEFARTMILQTYICPSDSRLATAWKVRNLPVSHSSYLGNAGVTSRDGQGTIGSMREVRIAMISDGTSNTILFGERPPSKDLIFGWWYAGVGTDSEGELDSHLSARITNTNVYPWYESCGAGPFPFTSGQLASHCSAFHYWSLHPGGSNFAFADGAVRFMKYDADSILPALATRAGCETNEVP